MANQEHVDIFSKGRVKEYYDYTLSLYHLMWHGHSLGVHYGFWYSDTKTIEEAILNTNRYLEAIARIRPGNRVFDAGCGIGGTSIWLAKNCGVQVVGVSLSPRQIRQAQRLAHQNDVSDSTSFFVMDYTQNSFESGSFDVVYGIESICVSAHKNQFLQEAYRLLRPGGRLVIIDAVAGREAISENERRLMEEFKDGYVFAGLYSPEEFRKEMKQIGFVRMDFIDKTKHVYRPSRRMFKICRIGYPISRITEKVHLTRPLLTKHNLGAMSQWKALKLQLWEYGAIYAEKP